MIAIVVVFVIDINIDVFVGIVIVEERQLRVENKKKIEQVMCFTCTASW